MGVSLKELEQSDNIAELLEDKELAQIGQQVLKGFAIDEDSRGEWQEIVDNAMLIAKQTMERKSHPFENSSNVKYPLITKAAVDFAARLYPEIIQNERIVKVSIVGSDPYEKKQERATRVSKFMSYQLLKISDDWEDGVDKLLHILPVLGTVFKKTYYHPLKGRPVSELCSPDKIVINYDVPSLEDARRITHCLNFYKNDIIERIRSKLFLDIDVETLYANSEENFLDEDAPIELLEQHCFLDLDEDGYQEPYIVTVHKPSGTVLRIVSRFKNIKKNRQGEVVRIEPEQYFTDFHFIRSSDGGFYSTGLGSLLYPLNSAINTLINQLVDSGTLHNNQSGFLGRGLRLKAGEFNLRLGEWKVLDAASGTNLAQNIVPLPTKEPSDTLFKLLGLMIEVGKDLVSVNDLMQGKGQTQNVAATTVLAMIEQGLKIYSSINKRLFRSLKKEFQKIFELNSKYLKQSEYARVVDDELALVKEDFDLESYDLLPVADPSMASDAQRLAKAQAVMQTPGIDPREASAYYLEALQLEEEVIKKLLPEPDPNAPPPPEVIKILAEVEKLKAQTEALQVEAKTMLDKQTLERIQAEMQIEESSARSDESAARIMKMKHDAMMNEVKLDIVGKKSEHQAQMSEVDALHKKEKAEIEYSLKAAELIQKGEENENPKS